MSFDAVVIVDWSGAARPRTGKDSIWVGVARRRGGDVVAEEAINPATRRSAEAHVAALLEQQLRAGERTLVGFDFPYAYPRGLTRALALDAARPAWRAVWDLLVRCVSDGPRNENRRFALASQLNARIGPGPGPFWGCSPRAQTPFLQARHKGFWDFPYPLPGGASLPRLRECERRMRGVQETWKLLGAGSVGSQALLGIPVVARLRDHPALAAVSRVWPFETGFCAQPAPDTGPCIVHAEIWPGSVPLDAALHPVRDAAQVLTLSRHLAGLEASELGALFDAPRDLDAAERAVARNEEGWILGARLRHTPGRTPQGGRVQELIRLTPDTEAQAVLDSLERDGAVILEDLLEPAAVDAILRDAKPLLARTTPCREDFGGLRTLRCGALMARCPHARPVALHPLVVEVARTLLGRWCERFQLHVSQLIQIEPGETPQPLHRDRLVWGRHLPREIEPQLNTLWALTDFTPTNGATHVIPGSQRDDWELEPDPARAVRAAMPRGSVLLYTGSVVHGGGANGSAAARLGMNLTYSLGWLRQEENQYLSCPPQVARGLSLELQQLLGYTTANYALGYWSRPEGRAAAGFDLEDPEHAVAASPTEADFGSADRVRRGERF